MPRNSEVPMHRVHVDHDGPVNGNNFLIQVDTHTEWVEICRVSGTNSKETIDWFDCAK